MTQKWLHIYTGIMTDTGSFNYSNTSSDTHIAAAELIKAGADHVTVCKKLNDTIKEAKLKLIAKIKPSKKELVDNNRSRSSILRVAEKM